MTTEIFAGERLEHPALAYTSHAGGREVITITGPLDRDAAAVLGRIIRRVLLAARGAKRPARFVLDFANAGYADARALKSLEGTSALVNGELGAGLEFVNVSEELRALLKVTRFSNVFTVHGAGDAPLTLAREMPI